MSSPELITRCRELRKEATNAEKILWSFLRNRQLDGVKFRRQHPVEGFILDFYCTERKLGIELDGASHIGKENQEYDKERSAILNDFGITILRFWNSEVEKDVEGVVSRIRVLLNER